MTEALEHLHPSVRSMAEEDNDSRVLRIRTDRWISYARADAALMALEDLLTFPKRTRMPNLLLVGPTNNGKTMIVEKFRRSHLPTPAQENETGVAHIPVVAVQMPNGPDEARFFAAILDAMGMPYGLRDRVSVRQSLAVRALRLTDTRLVIVDELHNLLSGTSMQQRRMLNLLRWLGNELRIPLVGVGTAEALQAIRSDDQLVNRFEPVPLPVWGNDDEYRQLLNTLEAILPLRRRSNLAGQALAGRILASSEGVLGEVIALIVRAAVEAVRSGTEAITPAILDRVGLSRPSERRRVTV